MNFALTDEQRLLKDTVQRLVSNEYAFEKRRSIAASRDGFSREAWSQFADLGLLALNIPESYGGISGGAVETMLVSEAMGTGLLLEPYLSSAVVATRAIVQFASETQQAMWLPPMSKGELIAVLAHEEVDADTPYDETTLTTRASRVSDGWLLSGRKTVVYHAPAAGLLLVSALVDAPVRQSVGLFAIPAGTPGISLRASSTVDGQRAADIDLDRVYVPCTSRLGGELGTANLCDVLDYGVAALCAEAVGALEAALNMTVEYSRTRVQFGTPIGKFQAIQHRMADMLMHVEQARSMAYLAASACTETDLDERRAMISAAKVVVSQAARFVGQQAVQLHGGMGMTDELAVSHYFKRLLAVELRFGSGDAHLRRYARGLRAA
jgi:alkylation response protein AidB-like acyl-CoA dehydrogenase